MGVLTWKQASADYEKKSAGSNTAGTTPPTSGMLSWKQAADEFDRYDEDGYKALGMQRMTQMQERYQAQKDRASGMERLHADDTVNDWLNRYNRVIQGITRSEQKRNGGFTQDADSVYGAEIDALLSGYDGIKNHSEIRQYYDSLTELKNSLNAINESFSQFEDESAFDQYMAYWKDQEEKKNLDLDAYSREIAALEQQLEDYDPQIDWTDTNQRKQYDKGLQELEDEINRRKQYYTQAQRIQRQDADTKRFADIRNRDDFAENSGFDTGNQEIGYRYINGSLEDRLEMERQYGQYVTQFADNAFDSLIDEEKAVYNYYMNTGDRESAAEYLKYVEEDIRDRKAKKIAKDYSGYPAAQRLYGLAEAGPDQFLDYSARGFGNMIRGSDESVSPSVKQRANALMMEEAGNTGKKYALLGDRTMGQALQDLATTTGNMFPSILVSKVISLIPGGQKVGEEVGGLMMGAGAAGSGYQEMINAGYNVDQARIYGIGTGAAEYVIEKLMGGISSLGGGGAKKLAKWAEKVDKVIFNFALRLGGSMGSEGFEEGIQEVFSGWLKSEVTHEDFYAKPVDVMYASLLGMASGGLFEGPSIISDISQQSSQGRKVKQSEGVDMLKEMGKASSDSATRALADRISSDSGNFAVGNLARKVESETGKQNSADIAKSLTQKGMPEKAAKQYGEMLSYMLEAGSDTEVQRMVMESDPVVGQTLREAQMPDSAVYQRLQNMSAATGKARSIDRVAALYGKQAEAVKQVYNQGQKADGTKQDVETFAYGFQRAFTVGRENGNASAITEEIAPGLTPSQRELAYNLGRGAVAAEKAEATKRTTGEESSVHILNEDGSLGDAVRIAEITSNDRNNVTYVLEDGRTVSEDQLSFSGDNAVLDTVKELGLDVQTANIVIRGNKTITKADTLVAHGIDDAFRYGSHGYSLERLAKDSPFAALLTEEMRTAVYNAGKNAPDAAEKKPPAVKVKTRGKNAGIYYDAGGGNVTAYRPKQFGKLEHKRESGVYAAQVLQKLGIGVDFYFFRSYVNSKGERVYLDADGMEQKAPNGWYDKSDGSIHIDLNAGNDGQGLTLFTMAHELTHFIEQWSPEKYKVLADFLIQNYEKGRSMDELVLIKQQALSAGRKKPVSYEEAYSEVIADSMEAMLADGNVMDKLRELKAKDSDLVARMKEFFDRMVKRITKYYQGLQPESEEGQLVLEMKDQFKQIQQLFAEALTEASENFQAAAEIGLEVDMDTESVSPAVLYSERTWRESDYVQERNQAAKEIAKAINVTEKKARQYIDSVNSIAKMIAEDRTRLDYFSSPGRSSFIGNVEYGGSFDFSTLCKKRRLLTGTFTAIQKALPNTALTANEILDIRNRMKDAGLEVSCGLCYVEGSRANMGQFAKEFLRLYKQYYPDAWQPNMADVNTPDGIEWVRINHPECYEQYEYFWNHYGTLKVGDKNLFASQQKPKLYQLHTEYKGEILQKFKGDDNVEEKNLNGGIRLQSFSDFEIVHLIDTMQIIMDMSRVGLAGQAYTKVPDFAWALGDTGLKINLSLIAKGVDESGNLIFDDIEGMPIAEAMKLRDRYSANVGTILVAFNDAQLMAAMADDRVDFIIPFHRSQWKKSQYEAMGLPAKTKDYTFMQNEKFIKPQYHEYRGRMVKDKATNYMPNEYWDFSKTGKENAEAYLQMCARNNKRPKFYKLLQNNGDGSYSLKADGSTDGYWKLLIDFKMYDNDGNGSPQAPVRPEFNMAEATRMLDDYKGGHSNFPVAQGIVDSFVSEYKENHGDRMYSDRKKASGFKDYDITAAVYEIRNEKAERGHDLVKIGTMPTLYHELFGLDGDVYVSNSHLYQNMVSRTVAEAEGRFNLKDHADYHDLGEEKIINAIDQFQDPLLLMESLKDFNEPRLVALLDEKGNDGQNLIAVLELYSPIRAYGSSNMRSHVLMTIYEKNSLPDYIEKTVDKGRILHKKQGLHQLRQADLQLVGDVTEETLKKNVARFNKKVKEFKAQHNISYQDRATGTSNRDLLAGAFDQLVQKPDEKEFLDKYRKNINGLNEQEAKLQELRRQIREISFGKGSRDTKKLKELRDEATKTANRINTYDKILLNLEATVPLKRVLERERQKVKQKADADKKAAVAKVREETKAAIEGVQSESEIMEREFLRLMRAYEKLSSDSAEKAKKAKKAIDKKQDTIDSYKADLATMEREFLRVMKGYETAERKTNAFWEGEFKRLMREYEASGRKVDRLEAKLKAQRESIRSNVDSRRRTVLRNKIRKDIRELDKILNKGNKKRNVKQGMQDFVAKAIATGEILFADLDSDTDLISSGIQADMNETERKLLAEAERYVRQIAELEGNEAMADVLAARQRGLDEVLKQLQPVLERERIRINSADASSAFDALVAAYESLQESPDTYIAAAFNPDALEYLRSVKHKFAGTLVRDMSQEQLQELHKCYKMVMTMIRDANKAFVDGRSVQADADQLVQEFQERKIPTKKVGIILRNLSNAVGWNYEKLYYALERINSPTLKRLYQNLADSENITMQDVQEAKTFQMEMVEKYHYNDWKIDQKMERTFLDNNGKEFQLTLGELMALYAYSRREGADRHIEVGGFTFGKNALTDPEPASTYKLTADQVAAISDLLTPEQKSFAEAMQRYLSKTMGAKGNEVSMKLYGIDMFGEENYFPLHIAGEYKARAQESQAKAEAGFQSMTNAGFTKARNTNATAPIVLESFMEVWVDHVNEMARYHGAVPALEDIRRVMNYSVYSDAMENSVSVKAAMTNAYGKQAVQYFDSLYREANSGAVTDKIDAVSKKLLSSFRKNSVAYSGSVVIQQPASIYRAKAIVDSKYFGKHGLFTLTGGVLRILNRKKWNASYGEMMKYAPGVTMAKEIGGFDTSSGGSIRSYLLDTDRGFKQSMKNGTAAQKAGALLNVVDDNVIANLPNVADKIAWIEIWEACRRETVANNPKLATSSEEFKQKVGQRFTEVIRATQVYDSMFSKSPMLKSKNLAVQYVVSFMNEHNTVANMAEKALRDVLQGNIKTAGKAIGALATSIVVTNLLKSIIYAMRDEDDDETFMEKYLSAVAGNLTSDVNPLNYIPYARDVWSIWQGYDVERADMAVIADAVNAIRKLQKLNEEDVAKMSEEELEAWDKKVMDAQWRVAETLSPIAGIPLKNVRREVLSVINAVTIRELDKNRTSTKLSIRHAVEEATGLANRSDREKLFDAIQAGDAAYVQRLKAGYKSEDAYHNAIRQALRDNESRIWEAANAWNSGDMDTYLRIAKEVRGEGRFEQDDIVLAIRAEANSMLESEDESASTVKGYFTNEKFGVALSQNNTGMADIIRKDLIDTKVANGKTREEAARSVESAARSQLKELFEDGSITGAAAEKLLVRYGGYDQEEAADKVADWKFESEYGFSYSERGDAYKKGEISQAELRSILMDVGGKTGEEADLQIQVYDWEAQGFEGATVSAVRNYNEYCAGTRVPKDVYLHIRKVANSTDNDVDASGKTIYYSAMKKIMAEIGGQYSLTATQKYAIAISLGWSDKNIEKYKTW